jgi:hypothetical protein
VLSLKYEKLIMWLSILAVIVSGAEKMVSCVEQRMFPETIREANSIARQVFAVVGLELGHLLFFFVSVIAVSIIKWIATKPKKLFENHKRLLTIYKLLCLTFLSVMNISVIYTLASNIWLLWINL